MSTIIRPGGLALDLRPYQAEAIAGIHAAWSGTRRPTSTTPDHAAVNRPACILPTGGGKTVIFAHLAAETFRAGGRTLVLVHRDELATQAAAKMHMAAPGAQVGIVKADRDDVHADIVIGSVQTLQNARRREALFGTAFSLGIADECHHAASPSWVTVMAYFGAYRPEVSGAHRTRWCGFTATMSREDRRKLGDVWEETAYTRSIGDLIDDGYLVRPRGIRIQVDSLDLRAVQKSRGDLKLGDLSDALMDADAPETAAKALLEHAPGRRTAAFWPTVATAEAFVDECKAVGLRARAVLGSTPVEERRAAYDAFRDGELDVLSTAMVLTEGWDAPWCDAILIGRPTNSRSLYTQMVGRGLRPWAGKADCLVLDLTGASERHDLATLNDLAETPEDDEEEKPKRKSSTPDPDAEQWEDPFRLDVPDGDLVATDVDLFAGRGSVWLRTSDRGWWFVPTQEVIYFLYPQATGHFAVGRARTGHIRSIERLEKDLDLGYAMAWAERYAREDDTPFGTISRRNATWRKNGRPATKGQIEMAVFNGVPRSIAEGCTKAQISDLIEVKRATRALAKVT